MNKILFYIIVVLVIMINSSCTKTSGILGEPEPFVINSGNNIPLDATAQANPTITNTNSIIPNLLFYTKQGISNVVYVDLTGISDPTTQQWLKLFGTLKSNQNIWIEVDNVPKGILVVNNSGTGNKVQADVVFLVDNSGSMSEEADSVANDIVMWSTKLAQQGLDLKFGCVGYSVDGKVNGAANLGNQSSINTFLNRTGFVGTSRTMGFFGTDSIALKTTASLNYSNCLDECGVQALRFADNTFKYRIGTNRIYVNFTDEPNQPNNKTDWSVEFLKDQLNWNSAQGTVHTVFSEDSTLYQTGAQAWSPLQQERPWLMSKYTGGTTMFVPSNFSGVNLDLLPVTGAITNTCTISFVNSSSVQNGQHTVKITIKSTNGLVTAERIFTGVKFGI